MHTNIHTHARTHLINHTLWFAGTGEPPYRCVGTLIYLRLVDQRRLEVGQVPLSEGVLLDLLLLLPFVFERYHLIVGSQVVAAAAAELRHGCFTPRNLATCRTLLVRVCSRKKSSEVQNQSR